MNANKLNTLTKLTAILAVLASFLVFGCSSDNSSPTGPDRSGSAQKIDEIVVSLDRLSVKYDCDYDPVGVSQPGDFRYNINVDTLGSDGNWHAASKLGESSAKINTGSSTNISNKTVTIRLPRVENQAFRVRLSLREVDGSSNDFSSSNSTVHAYHASSPQVYGPENTVFSSYSSTTQRGSMSWTVNKRDRTWAVGVLVGEGCNASLTYSVYTKAVN